MARDEPGTEPVLLEPADATGELHHLVKVEAQETMCL